MKTAMITVLLAIVFTSDVLPQQLEVDIVQVRLGRVYFGGGSDLGLTAGSPFEIDCTGRIVAAGIIEYAGPGISFSRPIAGLDTLSITDACRGRLALSGVDSSAVIRLGTDLPLAFFDLEHEPLLVRKGDSLLPNLADSIRVDGRSLEIFLRPNIRFSGGSQLDATTLAWCFKDLKQNGRSPLIRFFFSKLLPSDSGGIDIANGFLVKLTFYNPFPGARWFLSHPELAIYDIRGRGTGPVTSLDTYSGDNVRMFIPNDNYRGPRPRFARLAVTRYEESSRLHEDFEQKLLDGYIGFGFSDNRDTTGDWTSFYPFVAAMIAGVKGGSNSAGSLASTLYRTFDSDRAHLYFPAGVTKAAYRWLITGVDSLDNKRVSPIDTSAETFAKTATIVYDDSHLMETARFLADMASSLGIAATIERYSPGAPFDIRLTFLPASDIDMPFGLLAAVMLLNDMYGAAAVSEGDKYPGWADADRGCRIGEISGRNKFWQETEKTIAGRYGAVPLFRPKTEIVVDPTLKNGRFDWYGYPVLESIIKFKKSR